MVYVSNSLLGASFVLPGGVCVLTGTHRVVAWERDIATFCGSIWLALLSTLLLLIVWCNTAA